VPLGPALFFSGLVGPYAGPLWEEYINPQITQIYADFFTGRGYVRLPWPGCRARPSARGRWGGVIPLSPWTVGRQASQNAEGARAREIIL
jgi:hypothetical protein